MTYRTLILTLIGTALLWGGRAWSLPESSLRAAAGVIERSVPESGIAAGKVVLEGIDKADGRDVFEVSVNNGVLHVKGSSPVALCHGFYQYMKREGYGMVSWSGRRVAWPDQLKDCPVWRVESPVKHHYYFNVVTYGYTTPYWDWERWQREIDWMALHGIDMPLALVATEAIATRVWRKMGLTTEEIDRFYVGPAHLPWQRMGNIVEHDGGLPDAWHKGQIALQHRVLERMRALAMKPICPAFAGFVPREITRLYPEVKLLELGWGGWSERYASRLLSPSEPLFQEIGVQFITEWEKEFGKSDYYLADSFNEMEVPAPKNDLKARYEILSQLGDKVYQSIASANPDAVWVMQGWMFGYQRSTWTPDSLKALLSQVPDDKMLLLDLAADYNKHFWHNGMNWDLYEGFYNKPWVYSVIPNMGGKTGWTGVLEFYANGHLEALRSPNKGRLDGIGMAPEGIENNEMIYELLCDSAWTDRQTDLDQWLRGYAVARYGAYPQAVADSWKLLRESAYAKLIDHPRFIWQMRPGRTGRTGQGSMGLDEKFERAAVLFADASGQSPELAKSVLYRNDLIDMTVHLLGIRMEQLAKGMLESAAIGQMERAEKQMEHFRRLALLCDALLEKHPVLRLGEWVRLADQQGDTHELKTYYTRNAKRLVTVWGPPIDDYSARLWSGLVKDYYLARWELWLNAQKKGVTVDWRQWEGRWVDDYMPELSDKWQKPGDVAAEAREAVKIAMEVPADLVAEPRGNNLGRWAPQDIGTEWAPMEWSVPASELGKIKAVRFTFTQGGHRLDIRNVRLIGDGVVLAEDNHEGFAGLPSKGNIYHIEAAKDARANNECVIRAEVKGNGGTNSSGVVEWIAGD